MNLLFVKHHGKAIELTKAPDEALLATKETLELKNLNETTFYEAIQKELKARQEAKANHPL